ncbi:putative dna polymerase subunit alpha b protein [Phaeoacremonium minimum UCRPA7]|uniref:DNA polymerase alpha subunit B n=1 Tax=Phaeoacremonium minimum (strain UCR-PA7) TaxID=1286976 RepID=R8BSC8_PHAM7|nr:putative dna polymerase subunit alpha b protein [Phaeoacremonium minimum UCRPA7]EOO02267.1 putative dna polymerase subunit alpha b protein [Phaeoacremonium minimum UCRPA7]
MADPTIAELNDKFAIGTKDLESDVIAELQSIMRLYSLSTQDLFFKWESYCIKLDMDEMRPSVQRLRAFKQDLQDALEKSHRTQVHSRPDKRVGATPRGAVKSGDVFGIPSSFNDRPNAGEILEVLNEHLQAAEPPIAPFSESRIKLTAASDQKKLGYKPLAMKLSEASEILDDRIDDFMNIVMEHHKIDYSEFGSAASQSITEIIAVGRIASDSAEGKLNTASLLLETSRRMGGGLRVPLDVEKIKGYQFFPGQIVALRGSNTSGQHFTITDVLEIPLLPNAASTPAALATHREKLRGGPDAMDSDSDPMPLNVYFASGPYTADDNLDFEPLHQICSQAADTYADALILTGPFIDADHPLIATGDFDLPDEAIVEPDTATMSTVFKYMISPALNRLVASNPNVTILLVPSTRDVIDKHVSWPQDAFPRKELGLPKTAKIIGNPMTLSINEMVLGISSQDILHELRHEDALPPFAKVVESVLVINPGYLSKRRGAGTYARMTLSPPSLTDAESTGGMLGHRIFDRARVEITRI